MADFGYALERLKAGERVRRAGWNGNGMWLVLVPGSRIETREGTPYASGLGVGAVVYINQHIDMFTASGQMQPGWLASQADMLAEDWDIVE